MTFARMLEGMGLGGAYFVYTGFARVSFFFVRLTVRETRGRTLESM